MSDIEMEDINDPSQMEKGLLYSIKDNKSENKKLYCVVGCSMMIAFLFFILWLAESQFSEGVLRMKNVGEQCGFNILHDKKCSTGLLCRNSICHLPPNDVVTIYSNKTLPPPPPPTCPAVHPRLVTYFDYDEGPNRWLDPGPHGFYQNIYTIPYGGCKEVCSSQTKCKAISYHGPANQCHLMDQYFFPAPVNNTYNYAIKIV